LEGHKNGYKNAANEAIGTKTKIIEKNLRIWKEEIKNDIENKPIA
jgi:hypothetical protein